MSRAPVFQTDDVGDPFNFYGPRNPCSCAEPDPMFGIKKANDYWRCKRCGKKLPLRERDKWREIK